MFCKVVKVKKKGFHLTIVAFANIINSFTKIEKNNYIENQYKKNKFINKKSTKNVNKNVIYNSI